jgi:hypothetical protein
VFITEMNEQSFEQRQQLGGFRTAAAKYATETSRFGV